MMRRCTLSLLAHVPEDCAEGECTYWQKGGDDLEGGCAVERLQLHHCGEDAAEFLLDIRKKLPVAGRMMQADTARYTRPVLEDSEALVALPDIGEETMTIKEPAVADSCHLQFVVGIDDRCSDDCLFYEQTEQVGCLFAGAGSPPQGIARSLLKKAGRRSR